MTGSLFDRRAQRGDHSRARLLTALDDLLRERDQATVTIADITARAGVTRSAFYFYFESKAVAVAALWQQTHEQAAEAAREVFAQRGQPRKRFGLFLSGLAANRRAHSHLYRAMQDARYSSTTVRAHWESDRHALIEPLASMIDAERATGNAPAGPNSGVLATMLLELNDRSIEPLDGEDHLDPDRRTAALAAIWTRAIYATENT